ncbi:MAG: hypothetical protein KDI28_11500 [Pseudomonadales bacterium]|nr:hypothetical protein [Pseudomonadales bacterium]MCP5358233.1 hypothetical protein [Pseudomonadales bacterium]
MKTQIKRFSPHQNAKVFSVLMAVGSLPMLLLMAALSLVGSPDEAGAGFPTFLFIIFPIFYLIFGYLSIVFGCWLYNLCFRMIGGVECEFVDVE